MNILVVNDDGIDAEGIKNLVEALAEAGDIYVCAPHTQRSASGHGISIGRPVRFDRVPFAGAKDAFSLEGSPADCVKLGLQVYRDMGIGFDMVFSGINHGGNLGTDAIYSGTVAAALEGSINGIPSVALSIDARVAVQYGTARSLAIRAARMDLASLDPRLMLNINIPNLPAGQIKGIKLSRQGPREYIEWYDRATFEDGGEGCVYTGKPVFYEGIDCDTNDVGANQAAYISITPLRYDLTDYAMLERMRAEALFE